MTNPTTALTKTELHANFVRVLRALDHDRLTVQLTMEGSPAVSLKGTIHRVETGDKLIFLAEQNFDPSLPGLHMVVLDINKIKTVEVVGPVPAPRLQSVKKTTTAKSAANTARNTVKTAVRTPRARKAS